MLFVEGLVSMVGVFGLIFMKNMHCWLSGELLGLGKVLLAPLSPVVRDNRIVSDWKVVRYFCFEEFFLSSTHTSFVFVN